jgi:hypothetical protein
MFRAQVTEVLAMPERPTGFIVNLPRLADDMAAIVGELGLRVPQDVEIVFEGFPMGEPGKSCFPHARPNLAYRKIASIMGEMLARVRQHTLEQPTVVIPYEMRHSPGIGVVD